MQKPRYRVAKGRNGRFNFTLLATRGRIVGNVAIPANARESQAEMDKAARCEIAALVGELVEAVEGQPHEKPREP